MEKLCFVSISFLKWLICCWATYRTFYFDLNQTPRNTSSYCFGLPTWTMLIEFRNCQARNRCRPLSTSLCCGKRTLSGTSISILDEIVRMSESAKRRCFYHLLPDNKEQLNNFLKLLTNPALKQKLASTP